MLTLFNAFQVLNAGIFRNVMRRVLVLTHEAARHPFRQRLPHHVLAVGAQPQRAPRGTESDDKDWKLFLLSFAAFFTVAYTFIF